MLDIRKAAARGQADFGWLYAQHSFSFGSYFDPQQQGFSDLLVINEDKIQAAKGFATHPHRDMEIFTYVLAGALAHQDSMGNGSTIRPGDVQMMSAGSGIRHSEFNASDTELAHLLQIWIMPDRHGVTPRYQQIHFDEQQKRGRLQLIISPEGSDGSLLVYQDMRLYAGLFEGSESASFVVPPQRYVYLHLARGSLKVNGIRLNAGDGARIRQSGELHFSDGDNAEVLLFDLRPQELPTR
ncbi:pirin family protein [Neisseriaceae bacterium TC5R-5]|nr:pirin family protein [Neisseriaceae bacterium TC5R-5]